MTIQELGVKTLEHVTIKARQNTDLGSKIVEKGEPIIYFENLQIAVLSERSSIIAADCIMKHVWYGKTAATLYLLSPMAQ